MSLRFNRNTQPKWSAKNAWIEFVCDDPAKRTAVRCAVSRAALEDATGETVDSQHGIAVLSRHLARVIAAANAHYAAEGVKQDGMIVVDSDDLLPPFMPHLAEAGETRVGQHA